MSDDVERVRDAISAAWRIAWADHFGVGVTDALWNPLSEKLAERVLAAIRAAADETVGRYSDSGAALDASEFAPVLNAALAALTDHPEKPHERQST